MTNGWTVTFGSYTFSEVEFNSYSSGKIMQIYKYNEEEIRDCDHSLCREVYIKVAIPQFETVSSDFITLTGYIKAVCAYPEGESIEVEDTCDGTGYCNVGHEHGRSEAFIPPELEGIMPGVYGISLWQGSV